MNEYTLLDKPLDINELDIYVHNGRWADCVKVFVDSNKPAMTLPCKNVDDRKRGMNSIRAYIKAHKLPIKVYKLKRGNELYLLKVTV